MLTFVVGASRMARRALRFRSITRFERSSSGISFSASRSTISSTFSPRIFTSQPVFSRPCTSTLSPPVRKNSASSHRAMSPIHPLILSWW